MIDWTAQLTLGKAIAAARKALADTSETPDLDARILAADAAGLAYERLAVALSDPLSKEALHILKGYIARRGANEPVAYIVGNAEFWSLPFKVTKDTLIPRADSETLVEAVLQAADKAQAHRILDLGTGSGALLISLLTELPKSRGVAIDISNAALDVALGNAAENGVSDRFYAHAGSWYGALHTDQPFDIIISNPPYIRSDVVPTLMRDVGTYEPHMALDGGADGLDAYRLIIDGFDQHLAPDGLFAFEIGYDQADEVAELLQKAGYGAQLHRDLGQNPRCLIGKRAPVKQN